MSTTNTTTTTTSEETHDNALHLAAVKALRAVVAADDKRAEQLAAVENRNAVKIAVKAITFADAFENDRRAMGVSTDSKVIDALRPVYGDDVPSQPTISRYLALGRYVPRGEELERDWKRYTAAEWTDVHGETWTNEGTVRHWSSWVRLAHANAEQEARTHKSHLLIDDVMMTHSEYSKRTTVKTEEEREEEKREEETASEIAAAVTEATETAADGSPDLRAAVRLAFIGCDPSTVEEAASVWDFGEMSDDDLASMALAALATIRLRTVTAAAAAAA